MAKKDLSKMSLAELKAHRKEIDAAIRSFETRKRRDARAALVAVAKKHGMSLDDIVGTSRKRRKAKAPAKFRNPANPMETWSGRGRQPAWYKDAIAKGKSSKSMEI